MLVIRPSWPTSHEPPPPVGPPVFFFSQPAAARTVAHAPTNRMLRFIDRIIGELSLRKLPSAPQLLQRRFLPCQRRQQPSSPLRGQARVGEEVPSMSARTNKRGTLFPGRRTGVP